MRRIVRLLPRLVVLLVAVGAVAWGAGSIPGRSASREKPSTAARTPVDTIAVKQGRFEIVTTATGRLRAHRTVSVISPPMEGKIVALTADGATVRQDEVLCRLDDTDFRREFREASLKYENARAEQSRTLADRSLEARNTDTAVTKAREEKRILTKSNQQLLKQARAQLAFDEANLKRAQAELEKRKRLAAERLVPKEQVELGEIELRAKEYAVEKGKKEVALQEEKATSTERQKEIEVENAQFTSDLARRKTGDEGASAERKAEHLKLQMRDAQERLDSCTIRAPAPGLLLLTRDWRGDGVRVARVGDRLWPRSQLAEIPNLSQMVVACKIPEREVGGVRIGAPARVRLEENPERLYHAVVRRLSSIAEEADFWESSEMEPGTRTFTVILELRERDRRLYPGMTGQVEIVTESLPKALYLPQSCVFDRGDRHIVYRWVKGRRATASAEGSTARTGQNGFLRRVGALLGGSPSTKAKTSPSTGQFVVTRVVPGQENTRFVVIRKGLRPGDRVAPQEAP